MADKLNWNKLVNCAHEHKQEVMVLDAYAVRIAFEGDTSISFETNGTFSVRSNGFCLMPQENLFEATYNVYDDNCYRSKKGIELYWQTGLMMILYFSTEEATK